MRDGASAHDAPMAVGTRRIGSRVASVRTASNSTWRRWSGRVVEISRCRDWKVDCAVQDADRVVCGCYSSRLSISMRDRCDTSATSATRSSKSWAGSGLRNKSLKATTYRDPGSMNCRGLIFVPRDQDCGKRQEDITLCRMHVAWNRRQSL
jgi:hypothetical protein